MIKKPRRILFLEGITCPLCNCILSKPVLHCNKGHSICGKCYEVGGKCIFCSSSCDGQRTIHIENIVEKFSFPCKFSEKGCKVRCINETKEQHETECQTIFKCPIRTCTYQNIIDKIISHSLSQHKPFVCLTQINAEKNNIYMIDGKIIKGSVLKRQLIVNLYTTVFQIDLEIEDRVAKIAVNRYCYPSDSRRQYRYIIKLTFNNRNQTSFTAEEKCVNYSGSPIGNNYTKLDLKQFIKRVTDWSKVNMSIRILTDMYAL